MYDVAGYVKCSRRLWIAEFMLESLVEKLYISIFQRRKSHAATVPFKFGSLKFTHCDLNTVHHEISSCMSSWIAHLNNMLGVKMKENSES